MNEKQLKIFIRQAFSLENIADNALAKADPVFLRTMALVRRKVLELPDVTLLRDSEWRRLLGEIEVILQASNDAFAKSLIDELRINYPKMREQAEKMVSAIPSVNIFPGTAGEIKNLQTVAGIQTIEMQKSVEAAIRSTTINKKKTCFCGFCLSEKTITIDEYSKMIRKVISFLKGKNAAYNAKQILNIFSGNYKNVYYKEIVLLNTAAVLVLSNKCKNLKHGIQIAERNLINGNALKKLNLLRKFTN